MIYSYRGYNNCDSECDIAIIGHLVVATNKTGTSITNIAEIIATEICEEYNIPLHKLIWIEHYKAEDNPLKSEDTYDRVYFEIENDKLINPVWERV